MFLTQIPLEVLITSETYDLTKRSETDVCTCLCVANQYTSNYKLHLKFELFCFVFPTSFNVRRVWGEC